MTWQSARLKFVARFAYGDMLPPDEPHDGPFQVFGSNGPYAAYSRANTRAPAIVVGRKGSYGKINWSASPCFASDTTFYLDDSTTKHNLRWVFWLLQTLRLDVGSDEAAVPGLNREGAYENPVLIPSANEQRAIADFLDHQTARLDALVAAKERWLELLAEKRRALITRAVTCGLNPAAPLRNSGLSWLGKIPSHWKVIKIAHFARIGNGSTPARDNSRYWSGGSIPWLNSSVVNQNEVTESEQFVTELAIAECHLPMVSPGSLLVGITGQGKTRGSAVVLAFQATINQHLAYLTPSTIEADVWYLRWLFFACYDFLRVISDDAGGTKGALTCEELADMKLLLPPLPEQRAIVAYISAETARLDALRTATERTIELLRERRAALIAAAVTGNIQISSAA